MMKHEFEAIAGYEVSFDDYNNIIEPMYIASDLDKQEFVKCIDKKRFALTPLSKIIKDMKKCGKSLKESCTHYTDHETTEKLNSLIEEYIERKGYKGIAHWQTFTESIFSCYYPAEVVIYSPVSGNTIEKIRIA